ncbi:putative ABC transporter ATP-binding protein [compost metagenome]
MRIGYRGSEPLLRTPLSLTVRAGESWAIVGANGSGKTTLVKTLMGLIPPLEGQVHRLEGLRIGYVPQQRQADPIFPVLPLDIVLMGRSALSGPLKRLGPDDRKRALDWLRVVGMDAHAETPFRHLSGGQRQRVLIARALAMEPALLIMDEPTDGMDLAGEADFVALTRTLQRETGTAMMFVTHALGVAAALGDHVLMLNGSSQEAEVGPRDEMLTSERLGRLYQREVTVHRLGDATHVQICGPRSHD